VPIISTPQAFNEEQLYIDLRTVVGQPLYLKCEGFNFAGSVKLKAALSMVEAAETDGTLKPDSILIESSSGNLGIALAMIAASKGYRFLCVSDTHSNPVTCKVMQALGAEVHVITVPSVNGGFLGARLEFLRAKLESDSRYVWLNQYTNENNWGAHYRTTGPAIANSFPNLDVLFVGAGTCGTLTGCARYFRDRGRPVRIVAIDAVGSVTFGGPPSRRLIPGLGTAVRPAIADESLLDDLLMVEEEDTIRMCRQMAAHGFLFGGSSGTVVSGAVRWLEQHGRPGMTCVAISPDFGERYIESIYQDGWVRQNYSEQVLMVPSGNGSRWAHENGRRVSA
jgi:N-(2-amino-2-carboxyethyl)-L-glutamate synthase